MYLHNPRPSKHLNFLYLKTQTLDILWFQEPFIFKQSNDGWIYTNEHNPTDNGSLEFGHSQCTNIFTYKHDNVVVAYCWIS
jgi:hypothetical protein